MQPLVLRGMRFLWFYTSQDVDTFVICRLWTSTPPTAYGIINWEIKP